MVDTADKIYAVPRPAGSKLAGLPLDSLDSADYAHYFDKGKPPIWEDYSALQDIKGRVGLVFWVMREGEIPDSSIPLPQSIF